MQPGDTITPGSTQPEPTPAPAPQQAPEQPVVPDEPPAPPPQQEAAQPDDGGWYNADADEAYAAPPSYPAASDPVAWTASEYISHDKNAGWYMMVVGASLVLAAVIYLITRDWVSPVAIVTIGAAFAAFGARKPQVLQYGIDNVGVHIGQKLYPYGLFRTFSVIEEDAAHSILLMPMQRFNLPISIYYDPADEDRIIEALGTHLPHEDRQLAPIDNFMRKIRF